MSVIAGTMAVLMIISPTYGDYKSEPMPIDACYNELHVVAEKYDTFAKHLESIMPRDLSDKDMEDRINEIWNFEIYCEH